jgi:hypothetical protein
MSDIKIKKIFAFGSCRVQDNKYNIHSTYGPPYDYSIKSVVQFIDFFENPNKWNDLPSSAKKAIIWKEWVTFEKLKHKYEEADIILVEISSFKLKMYNGISHADWRLLRNGEDRIYRKNIRANLSTQTYDDLINDIKIIKSKIKKPLIFQGQANLIFNNLEEFKDNNYRIKSRELIDKAIISLVNENNRIIINEVFGNYYNQEHWRSKDDSWHYSDKGYKLIADKLNEIIKKIS